MKIRFFFKAISVLVLLFYPASLLRAAIIIDGSNNLFTFNPLLLTGNNFGSWVATSPALISKVQAANSYYMRYPAGGVGENWHWNGTGTTNSLGQWVPNNTTYSPGFQSNGALYYPMNVTDGNGATLWRSNAITVNPNNQWIYINLGSAQNANSVQIDWSNPYALSFKVQYWTAGGNEPITYSSNAWTDTSAGTVIGAGANSSQTVNFTAVNTQYIRILCLSPSSLSAYAIKEIRIYQGATQLTVTAARALNYESSTTGYPGWNWDFITFMSSLQAMSPQGKALISVNLLGGTPQEAAAWVHYANTVRGYNIKYWEVGNEPEGFWDTNLSQNPAEIAKRFVAFYDAMHAEDPSITIMGPAAAGWNSNSNNSDGGFFIQEFIQQLVSMGRTDALQALSFHVYGSYIPSQPSDFLNSAANWPNISTTIKGWLSVMPNPDIPFDLSEYNIASGSTHYFVDQSAGVFIPYNICEYLKNFGGKSMANLFDIINGSDENTSPTGGSIGYLRDASDTWHLQEYPPYWGIAMVGTKWAQQGSEVPHTFLGGTSSDPAVTAYGCIRPDGNLAVIAVNHTANPVTSNIQVVNFSSQVTADLYSWDSANYNFETITAPYHADVDTGIALTVQNGANAVFSHTFPAYSIRVWVFHPAAIPTMTFTPSRTPTLTRTMSPTNTPTRTWTATSSASASVSPTFTNTRTPTGSVQPTNTSSVVTTATSTNTMITTPTNTSQGTVTNSPVSTLSATASVSPTITNTRTQTSTVVPTSTFTLSTTPTYSRTITSSMTPQNTFTNTRTNTPVNTPTNTPANSVTITATITDTVIISPTDTPQGTATNTPAATATNTITRTTTATNTPQDTSTNTPVIMPTNTRTNTFTVTPTNTAINTSTASATPSVTVTRSVVPSATYTGTLTPTGTGTVTLTCTRSFTCTYTKTPMPSTPTLTNTPANTVTLTPTPAATMDKFEITDTVAYPNPYNRGQNMYFGFNASQDCSSVTVKIYTVSYRLVLKEDLGACSAGHAAKPVPAYRFNRLANGTYYYIITAKSVSGKIGRSQIQEFVVLR